MTVSHTNRHDAIVFDLGGVVVDWQPRYLYQTLISDPAELDFFLKEVCNGPWMGQTDGGTHDWPTATEQLCARFPRYRTLIKAFRPRWMEMLCGDIPETVAIVKRLKAQGQRLLALTNWATDTYEESLPRLPALQFFEDVVVSGREKLRKPDRRIFELVASRYGIDPARSIFIDDNRNNVDAAARLGFDALFFSSPGQLAADLTQRGALRA